MAIIALEGMRFFAEHGVFEEERILGNFFEVDVWVNAGNVHMPQKDSLDETLDYAVIYKTVARIMGERRHLLETLLVAIGEEIVREWPEIVSVRVRVTKENPPVGGDCRRAFVEEEFKGRGR
ncbi:MAG: dihydroneopterin aldolase [Bacteroidia bacterium]